MSSATHFPRSDVSTQVESVVHQEQSNVVTVGCDVQEEHDLYDEHVILVVELSVKLVVVRLDDQKNLPESRLQYRSISSPFFSMLLFLLPLSQCL